MDTLLIDYESPDINRLPMMYSGVVGCHLASFWLKDDTLFV